MYIHIYIYMYIYIYIYIYISGVSFGYISNISIYLSIYL